jgi:uncharacterized integral membrane protein
MSAEHPSGRRGDRPAQRDQRRQIAVVAVLVVALVFALVNFDKVKVHWIVTTSSTPLIVVIVLSFLLGVAADRIAVRRARRKGG